DSIEPGAHRPFIEVGVVGARSSANGFWFAAATGESAGEQDETQRGPQDARRGHGGFDRVDEGQRIVGPAASLAGRLAGEQRVKSLTESAGATGRRADARTQI